MSAYEIEFPKLSTYIFDRNHFLSFLMSLFRTKDIDEYNYWQAKWMDARKEKILFGENADRNQSRYLFGIFA